MGRNAILISLAVLLLSACGGQANTPLPPDSPISSNDPTATPTAPPSGGVIIGEATVESVEFLMLESFPVQIMAAVRGSLPDGCSSIGEITQTRDQSLIKVHIATTRPKDMFCTMALIAFEKNISLDVYGLPKGVYQVDINGYKGSFELTSDNILK